MTATLVALGGLLLAGLLARRASEGAGTAINAMLEARLTVALVSALTLAMTAWSWGSVSPPATVHDETAYLLQARIFASGHWTALAPPVPEFWEQAHVLVQPVVAAKYFPGHSLLLALGVLSGWPALVPLLLQALTGALVFVLARRTAGSAVALLSWVLWLALPSVRMFVPSYLSEVTTAACWLAGWYCLLRWRDGGRTGWLVALALVTGWGAITRPLTMLVWAVPVGIVVLAAVARARRWRAFAGALVAGAAVLAVVPLWSARTTGSWRETPLAEYTAQYMPWDVPGLGLTVTAPSRALTPDMRELSAGFRDMHAQHTARELPATLAQRVAATISDAPARYLLMACLLAGLLTIDAVSGVAVASAALLVLAYLSYATSTMWLVYHYEAIAVLAFLAAAGVARACAALMPARAARDGVRRWRSVRLGPALLAASLGFTPMALASAGARRDYHLKNARYFDFFGGLVARIPEPRAVVFVRYGRHHIPDASLVENSPDLSRERVWMVYDRGDADNARLMTLAPGRAAYLLDEDAMAITAYRPDSPR